ncbi:MAG: ParB/RepB/Spo0J family partition protein [Geothrix sp.]|jgi:ParB family chromosome partitioning protein|uniref:ParB/RepB/Spo0J family partition protein n=1 Tax=Candidatus Geothrix odensensis TaxID=2954440 RepID=A0A936F4Y5_9BACT|nr:ParB/RepB/Spo0J family partition protein [Candidatus Geothrix odensensis]MBP7617034.1 ParB/RepB/Spo0J family partition protein [Geothrix sp.]MCC6512624.1 ParB/RepB/Spo0J family partition protein [Geothrix sp.]
MTLLKRPALGRGLTSLMSQMAPEDAGQRELPLGSMVPNRAQPRTHFDEAALAELAESLRQHGMVQPIVVRKVGDQYEIIAGERRWRAARKAGLAMVPVVVKEVPDDRLLEIALVENIQRQELNPIEEATAYWQLGEHLRLTQEQVADRVGKSRPQVANTLRLLRLPAELKAEVAHGRLSTGHAKVLLGVPDPRLQEQLAYEVVQSQLSVRALEARIQQLQKQTKAKGRKKHPQELFIKAAAEELTQSWGTRVEIKAKGKTGTLVLHYGSEGELDRLFEALKHGPAKRR